MKCLLIGGLGYIGGRLAQYLHAQGHDLTLTTRRPESTFPAWAKPLGRIVSLSLSNRQAIGDLLQDNPVVIHLAGPDEIEAEKNASAAIGATEDSLKVLLEVLSQPAQRSPLIYLSTFHIYGKAQGMIREDTPPQPAHPYALAKRAGEIMLDAFQRQTHQGVLRVRLSNGFGAPAAADVPRWTLVFNDLCRQAMEKRRLTLKSAGHQQRNFITLSDVARALEFLASHAARWPSDGRIHLGSSLQWSIREVADHIAARTQTLFGYKPSVVIPPAPDPSTPPSFEFNLERLNGMGFKWLNDWQSEVDNTLRLCQTNVKV